MSTSTSICLYYVNFSTFANSKGVCRHSLGDCRHSPVADIHSNIYIIFSAGLKCPTLVLVTFVFCRPDQTIYILYIMSTHKKNLFLYYYVSTCLYLSSLLVYSIIVISDRKGNRRSALGF